MKEWQKLNVLNYEMESATLFTMARLKAGMISATIASRVKAETPDDSILHLAEMKMILALKEALVYLIG
jgi:uridine phosphorylase